MDRVFHFSDFHISPSSGEPKENVAFSLLLNSLKKYSSGDNYIVYTGDVIDAPYVTSKPEAERNKAEKESYSLAIKYFTSLQIALGVQQERVVFCAGNHDIRRGAVAGEKDLCDPGIQHDESKYKEGFSGFCDFHKELLGREFDYSAHLESVGDYRFFVANSVWHEKNDPSDVASSSGRKKEYPRCISCENLLKALEEHRDTLEQNSKHEKTFFLIHDPSIAWCENANLEYARKAVREQIDVLFNYRLCGDKHTRGFVDNFHIVGNRLSSKKITYGFVEYSDRDGEYKQVILDCEQNKWTALPDSKAINRTVEISKAYVKPGALSLVFDNSQLTICNDNLVNLILSASERISKANKERRERWINLNRLFEKIASYQIPIGGPGEKIALDGNIFTQIFNDIISDNDSPFRLFVRGKPSRGKSVFLSIEYLFLLSLFKNGLFPFVPVLINCESLVELSDLDKISEVNSFFNKAKVLGGDLHMPVCYILDGVKEYKHYWFNIEDHLYRNYLFAIDNNQQAAGENIFIIAIDMEDQSNLPATTISEIRKAHRLLYFSELETEGPKKNQAEEFVSLFCQTVQGIDKEVFVNNLSRLQIPAVDLNLLFHQGVALSDQNDPPTICRLYEKYFLATITDPIQQEVAKKHAYGVLLQSIRYDAFTLDNMSMQTYNCLLRENTLTYYLAAVHYCDEIVLFSKDPSVRIPDDSVLNHFFNQEQNRILSNVFIDQKIQEGQIKGFIQYHFNELQSSGKSQFIYLLSVVNTTTDAYVEKKSRYSNPSFGKDKRELFYDRVADRTDDLMAARKERSKMEAYIELLISNPEQRRLNRAVHMLYYADINETEAIAMEDDCEDTVFAGFDIFHSFYTLLGRAQKNLAIPVNRLTDWLVFLDVFTLCDFIQERLRTPTAKTHAKHSVDAKSVDSFFYTKKYHAATVTPKGILQEMINLVSKLSTKLKSLNHDVINAYFSQCLLDFRECLSIYNHGHDCLSASMFHPSKTLNALCKLSSVDRSGWKIPERISNPSEKELSKEETKAISEKLDQYLGRESLESVMIHTFEMYIIGLLYLPEEKPNENGFEEYNKQKILNMILLHDIGECETGDIPYFDPRYSAKKKKENEFNQKTFIGGAFSGFADLTNSLKLWNEWLAHTSINSIIAHELDTIQLLYKYYCLKNDPHFSDFTPDRRKELEDERSNVSTSVGQNILNTVVYFNPKFNDHK